MTTKLGRQGWRRAVATGAAALVITTAACRTLDSNDVGVRDAPLEMFGVRIVRPRLQLTQTLSAELAALQRASDSQAALAIFCASAAGRVRAFGTEMQRTINVQILGNAHLVPLLGRREQRRIADALTQLNRGLALPSTLDAELCKGILGAASLDPRTANRAMLNDLHRTVRDWPAGSKRCLTLTLSPSEPDDAPLNWSFVTADRADAAAVQYTDPSRSFDDIYDSACVPGTTWASPPPPPPPPPPAPWCGRLALTNPYGPVRRCYRPEAGGNVSIGFHSPLTGDYARELGPFARADNSHSFSRMAGAIDGSGTFLFVGGPVVRTGFGDISYGEQRWPNSGYGPVVRWGAFSLSTQHFHPSHGWMQDLGDGN